MDDSGMTLVDRFLYDGLDICRAAALDVIFEVKTYTKIAAMASITFVEAHASTFVHDASIALATFLFTHVMYKYTKNYLAKTLPGWENISSFTQNRLSCELAMLPSRFAIFLCCVPAILNAFASEDFWSSLDTRRTILVCAIMAGAYAYDLMIERNDILSLIHHCFGPAMLLWIRTSFATYTASDAHMDRLLVSFIFFGAGVGGSITTFMLVVMKLVKTHLSQEMLYRSVSALSWALTVNTFIATMFGTWYMLVFHDTLYEYWGSWCYVPLILSSFEFYLQWRWALRFQSISDSLGVKAGHTKAKEIQLVPNIMAEAVTKLPGITKPTLKAKSLGLSLMVTSWGLSYITVFANAVQKTMIKM